MSESTPDAMPCCPKCDALLVVTATACSRCGLLRARMPGYVPAPLASDLVAAWEGLTAQWSDDAGHRRFLELAQLRRALPAAARLYRSKLAEPATAAQAEAQLERIGRMAAVELASVAASRVAEPAQPYKNVIFMLVIMVGLALAAWVYFELSAARKRAGQVPTEVPAAGPGGPQPAGMPPLPQPRPQ